MCRSVLTVTQLLITSRTMTRQKLDIIVGGNNNYLKHQNHKMTNFEQCIIKCLTLR